MLLFLTLLEPVADFSGDKGCAYRWFSTAEICMILERFNALFFIGDGSARVIYGVFNVLLTEDLEFGTVREWEMESVHKKKCRCETMFLPHEGKIGPLEECGIFEVTASDRLIGVGEGRYQCNSKFYPTLSHIEIEYHQLNYLSGISYAYIPTFVPCYYTPD